MEPLNTTGKMHLEFQSESGMKLAVQDFLNLSFYTVQPENLFPNLTSETSAWLLKMLMVSFLCMHLWLITRYYRAELAWHLPNFFA